MNFQGLNILIAGAGISGIAAAKTVAALGAAVTLADGRRIAAGSGFFGRKRSGIYFWQYQQ